MSGSSKYPKALDALPIDSGSSTNAREGKPTGGPEGFHSGLHNDTSAAINALQETLGSEPQGKRTTVAERLGVIEGEVAAGLGELPEDIASKVELEELRASAGAGMGVVVYDSEKEEWPARPESPVVTWIGTPEPEGMAEFDIWRQV